MERDAGTSGGSSVSPDEAFAVLGNEIRIGILQALGEAGGPLSFTALRERVGIRQGAQFNYHLDKVVGHFVAKTDDGYALRPPGRRVVEAVLSGAVTEDPLVEPTGVDWWVCPYCGGRVEVSYGGERVSRHCTECPGFRGHDVHPRSGTTPDADGRGDLGALSLPPAGVQGRSPGEMLRAAFTWGYAEWLVAATGVCPRCSGTVDHSVRVCEDHDATDGFCPRCGERKAVQFRGECTNCIFGHESILSMYLAGTQELLAFATAHGRHPLSEPWDWGWEYGEEVLSTDPFEGRFTFEIDGDAITLTVDANLDVVGTVTG